MTLLFDEHLPPSLCKLLEENFPGSESVLIVGLGGRSDRDVLEHAVKSGHVVVTKDADFVDLAHARPQEVKVIRVTLGNCSIETIYLLLANSTELILRFGASDDVVLEIP